MHSNAGFLLVSSPVLTAGLQGVGDLLCLLLTPGLHDRFEVRAHHYTGIKFVLEPSSGSAGLAPGTAEIRLIDDFGNFAAVQQVPISIASRRIEPNVPDRSAVSRFALTDESGTAVFEQIFVEARGKHVLSARFFDYQFIAQKVAHAAIAQNDSEHACISRDEFEGYRDWQNSSWHAQNISFADVSGGDECIDIYDFVSNDVSADVAAPSNISDGCMTAGGEFYDVSLQEKARICDARRHAATGTPPSPSLLPPLTQLEYSEPAPKI